MHPTRERFNLPTLRYHTHTRLWTSHTAPSARSLQYIPVRIIPEFITGPTTSLRKQRISNHNTSAYVSWEMPPETYSAVQASVNCQLAGLAACVYHWWTTQPWLLTRSALTGKHSSHVAQLKPSCAAVLMIDGASLRDTDIRWFSRTTLAALRSPCMHASLGFFIIVFGNCQIYCFSWNSSSPSSFLSFSSSYSSSHDYFSSLPCRVSPPFLRHLSMCNFQRSIMSASGSGL